ncbi:urease accessory protein [Noviherbaspirillum humi]|uniref:Urease accessory protein UreE n=1 Tax=Noviherbaspirillum humi TaxID=1688639 RepID=A0A239J9Q9_9BURK|nr:urease accessory protein UreE [Noviherbaspirillum humi]SNT02228.1 urease accessory protein [Noviherbaspirillum humi]
MLTLNNRIEHADRIDGELILPFDLRVKSRLRAQLASGEEVAVFIARGAVLRDGSLLRGDDGRVVRVVAAPEAVYRVSCATPHGLLRCAYHLGNRHTQVQIVEDRENGCLLIRQDPVLKDMLEGLGAIVTADEAPFEPESGAYGGGHHHHGAEHGHPLAPVPVRQRIHRPGQA